LLWYGSIISQSSQHFSPNSAHFTIFSEMSPQSTYVVAGVAATVNLFRLAADIISCATAESVNKHTQQPTASAELSDESVASSVHSTVERREQDTAAAVRTKNKRRKTEDDMVSTEGFGSMATPLLSSVDGMGCHDDERELDATLDETQPSSTLLTDESSSLMELLHSVRKFPVFAFGCDILVFLYLLVACIMSAISTSGIFYETTYDPISLGAATVTVFVGIVMHYRDKERKRFNRLQRFLGSVSALILVLGAFVAMMSVQRSEWKYAGFPDSVDLITLVLLLLFAAVFISEARFYPYPRTPEGVKVGISLAAIVIILKPYFWPSATEASTATGNRIRAFMTWVFVAASKACNLISPLLLGKASTALAMLDYKECIKYAAIYTSLQFAGAFFKECQNLIYLKVAQAAFVQLSEFTFVHLLSLPLEWHLTKKLGEVLRSMDRGITACDTLMKYLFLWLVPTIAECILVCIIFIVNFRFLPLAVSVFYFVFVYIVMTVVVTLWRKKFQRGVTKADNLWHDICTDSIINFETVKYFTAENYELKRFSAAVEQFQLKSVDVQASLSFLNILQQLVLQACLASSLILSTYGIRQRINCCIDEGCEGGNSQCCNDISMSICPGMEIGDFVSVLTYTLNLFTPLNFLGFIYNIIVMAAVDLTNLSELLAEKPDVVDAPDAIDVPRTNEADPSTVVEFDNVIFHYPTQPETSGLKGLSFKMKKGTTTAIVGPTGAGKTTVSRLLFRFYDVRGGAVKINGVDLRAATQASIRDMIGVVPQMTNLFNDTIRNNITYGKRDATQEELDAVARDAQIMNFIASLPDGWDTLVGDRGLKLSGGEKQRTAIARCLLKNPPIVLLDEATSALDTLTESSVQEALDRLGHERTVLVIAHRLGTIRNADNIVVLDDGIVAEEGTHEELLALGGKYAELWDIQVNSTSAKSSRVDLSVPP